MASNPEVGGLTPALKGAAEPASASAVATPSNPVYSGPALDRVIGIAALPRSGTTVLSAVLGAHSRIHTIYEPWNANKENLDLNKPIFLQGFLEQFSVQVHANDILLVKETTTDHRYLDRLNDLLTSVPDPIMRDLVVILRNPFHTFQSEVQARREWWGEGALEITCALFDEWAERSLANMRRLALMACRYDALIVSYERFVRKETAIQELMHALGITMEQAQLEYEKHVNTRDVRGDIGLASKPRPLQADSIERRGIEQQSLLSIINVSNYFEDIKAIEGALLSLAQQPLSRAHHCSLLIDALNKKRNYRQQC